MNEFTYQGQTVVYTDNQKALLLADQNAITTLQNRANYLSQLISQYDSNIAVWSAAVSENPYGSCWSQNSFGKWKKDDNCYNQANANWNNESSLRSAAQSEKDNINTVLVPVAVKKLNDDLKTIQDDIKLQIQATTTNATNANLPNQSNLDNQLATATLNAQSAAAALKQENTVTIIKFVVIAIVILGIAFFVAKRV